MCATIGACGFDTLGACGVGVSTHRGPAPTDRCALTLNDARVPLLSYNMRMRAFSQLWRRVTGRVAASMGDRAPVAGGVAAIAPGDVLKWVLKRTGAAIGVVLVIVALPLIVLPIPLGLPLLLIGMVILLNTSDTAKRLFVRWRRRYPITGRRVRSMMRRRKRM